MHVLITGGGENHQKGNKNGHGTLYQKHFRMSERTFLKETE